MFWDSFEKGIVFFPDSDLVGTPADLGLAYENVWFATEDGVRLNGWWVPRPHAPVLLWFHGNAGNISHRLENIKLLVEEVAVQVFIFDYREYGKSEGRISREGTLKDAAAAYRYLTAARGVPGSDIILFGRSLGTALATGVALSNPSRALILESPFTSSQDMIRLYVPFLCDWHPKVMYDNLGRIGTVRVPVLVIHGSHDEVIPVDMGRLVFAAAPEPKELYIIPGAHHNDTYLVGGPEYVRRLRAFIERK